MRPRFTDILVRDFTDCNTRGRLFTAFNRSGPVRGHLVFGADGGMMAYLEADERKAPHSSAKLRLAIER